MTASSILDRLVIFANPNPKWLQISQSQLEVNYMSMTKLLVNGN